MAASDEKRDDLERLLGKPEAGHESKEIGEFTRTFFGLQTDQAQTPGEGNEAGASKSTAPPVESSSVASPPPTTSTTSEFTRFFGNLNANAPPLESSQAAEDASYSALHGELPAKSGAFADLFAPPSQAPIEPAPANSYSFEVQDLGAQASCFAAPDLTAVSGSALTPAADPFAPSLSKIDARDTDKPADALGIEPPMFAPPGQGKPQKATRLFSLPRRTQDQVNLAPGPSAFTRVIDSSALRSGQESAETGGATGNPSQQAPAREAPAPPQAGPAPWPVVPIPAPQIQPQAYMPPQPMPVQVSMPPIMGGAWPQGPSFPASAPVPAPQPQLPAREQAPEQKWVAYLPLIIGLNLLFFVAVLLILLFALSR